MYLEPCCYQWVKWVFFAKVKGLMGPARLSEYRIKVLQAEVSTGDLLIPSIAIEGRYIKGMFIETSPSFFLSHDNEHWPEGVWVSNASAKSMNFLCIHVVI